MPLPTISSQLFFPFWFCPSVLFFVHYISETPVDSVPPSLSHFRSRRMMRMWCSADGDGSLGRNDLFMATLSLRLYFSSVSHCRVWGLILHLVFCIIHAVFVFSFYFLFHFFAAKSLVALVRADFIGLWLKGNLFPSLVVFFASASTRLFSSNSVRWNGRNGLCTVMLLHVHKSDTCIHRNQSTYHFSHTWIVQSSQQVMSPELLNFRSKLIEITKS